MNNIIWNEKELKYIKKIILTKVNLNLTTEGELVKLSLLKKFNYSSSRTSLFSEVIDELKDLFYITDREKINEVLTSASQVKADPNNRLHYGLITTLSQINPNNHEEIFCIFKGIVAQYEHALNNIVTKISTENKTALEMKTKINEITNYKELSTEEKLIKKELDNTFIFANGVTENELFRPLTEKLDSMIKPKLISSLSLILNNRIKFESSNREITNYKYEFHKRFLK